MFQAPHKSLLFQLCVCAAIFIIAGATSAQTTEFLLIQRSQQPEMIQLVSIDESGLVHLSKAKGYQTLALDECIALLNPKASRTQRVAGMLELADGQRLPGEAVQNAKPSNDALAWHHPWLGRLEVPLQLIETVAFTQTAVPPEPDGTDVVLLANGDRQGGFIIGLGNPVSIEVDQQGTMQVVEIPLRLVSAVRMVAAKPAKGASLSHVRRVWFNEGTVLDMPSISVHDNGSVRLGNSPLAAGTPSAQVNLSQIAAILLQRDAMISLAELSPTRVEAPVTRYSAPRPRVMDADAPLGLSAIELQGPVVVRYGLPSGCVRLSAQAELPRGSQDYGDYELVIRLNDDELFRARMNRSNPVVNIEAPLPSSAAGELTLELLEAGNGPVQDRLVLHRPVLIKRR